MSETNKAIDLTCKEVIQESCIEPCRGAQDPENVASPGVPAVCEKRSPRPTRTSQARKRKENLIKSTRKGRIQFPIKRKVEKVPRLSVGKGHEYAQKVNEDPIHKVLPIEVRYNILRQFPLPQLLSLRVVSRAWRSTINSLLKLNVKIDGNAKEFKGECGLPIHSCKIIALQDPMHRRLFKQPSPEEVHIVGGICHINFQELALQWSCLTKLELCWRSLMKNLLFGKAAMECSNVLKKRQIFPNLAILRIEILTNENLNERSKLRIQSNIAVLTSYNYPCLAQCSMTFVGYLELHAEDRHLSVLLPFLHRHANSLQTLDFTMKYASHTVAPPIHPRHILFCVPANLKSIPMSPTKATETQLIVTQLQKLNESPEHHLEWIEMLKNRRKLEIAIMTRFLNWSIKHLDFFTPTIRDYGKYLRRIELMNLTMYNSGAHNTVTQLDAVIFLQCPQLTHLHIFRAPIIFHENEVEPAAEMVNFHVLPGTLQEIIVDGLPISSDEILIATKKLDALKTFHYLQSQVPRRNMLLSNGISWEVLQTLMMHPKLENVKVHLSMLGNAHLRYEPSLQEMCKTFGWSSMEIVPGYLHMHQITLSRS